MDDPPLAGVRHMAATLLEAWAAGRLSYEEAHDLAGAALDSFAAVRSTAESGRALGAAMLDAAGRRLEHPVGAARPAGMRVQFRIVGRLDAGGVPFPDVYAVLDAVPAKGDEVSLPHVGELAVRTVVWYPAGDVDAERPADPFVYIVVGEPRAS